MLTVKIIPNDKGNPPGKLADAELHFCGINAAADWLKDLAESMCNPSSLRLLLDTLAALDGLKLIGFAVWERRASGGRSVTFPARQYSVNGERRSFALLRPIGAADATTTDRIRDLILDAYAEYERTAEAAVADGGA